MVSYLDTSTDLSEFSGCFEGGDLSNCSTEGDCCCEATESGAAETDVDTFFRLGESHHTALNITADPSSYSRPDNNLSNLEARESLAQTPQSPTKCSNRIIISNISIRA